MAPDTESEKINPEDINLDDPKWLAELITAFKKGAGNAKATTDKNEGAAWHFQKFLNEYERSWYDLEKGSHIAVDVPLPEGEDGGVTTLSNRTLLDYYLLWVKSEGYAESSIRTMWYSLRPIITFFWSDHNQFDTEDSPVESVSISKYTDGTTLKEERIGGSVVNLTESEYQDLLDHLGEPVWRNRLICNLIIETGMRRSEVAALNVSDVTNEHKPLKRRHINVPATKSDGPRDAWFSRAIMHNLNIWINNKRKAYSAHSETDALFIGKNGRLDEGTVSDIIGDAAEAAGLQESRGPMGVDQQGRTLKNIAAHALRDTYANRCIANGMDLYALSRSMGHASVKITEKRYLGDDYDYRREQAEKFAPKVTY